MNLCEVPCSFQSTLKGPSNTFPSNQQMTLVLEFIVCCIKYGQSYRDLSHALSAFSFHLSKLAESCSGGDDKEGKKPSQYAS